MHFLGQKDFFIFRKREEEKMKIKGFDKGIFTFKVRDIVEIAMLVALAIVLDQFCKIKIGATGGSLNFSMLPIMIIGLRHGWFKCFFAGGIVYGLITCMLDGYGFLPYPLEYFIGFGSVCVVGLLGRYIQKNYAEKKLSCYFVLLGSVICWAVIRFIVASIDSVILYDLTWLEAFVYNSSYIPLSALMDFVGLSLLLPVIQLLC